MAFFDGIFCPILQFFNTFLSPDADPDRPRGGPSHVDNTSCVKNQVNRRDRFSLKPNFIEYPAIHTNYS